MRCDICGALVCTTVSPTADEKMTAHMLYRHPTPEQLEASVRLVYDLVAEVLEANEENDYIALHLAASDLADQALLIKAQTEALS